MPITYQLNLRISVPGNSPSPPLLYTDTTRSPDALYFGQVNIPDPFIAFSLRGKKYAIVSALEFGRVRKTSDFDSVLPLDEYLRRARVFWPERKIGPAEVIVLAAQDYGQRRFTVPEDFPAAIYQKLTGLGLELAIADGPLFPSREIKTPTEIAAIREGNHCSALGFAAAELILRSAKVKGRQLHHRGKILTSETLKFAIEVACLEAGAVSANTIVAGGDQACDPHERGTGPLRAHELIIIDIFPRVTRTGFHGDMTRTFLRGRANEAQRGLVDAVRSAQIAATKSIRAGVNGRFIHNLVVQEFLRRGFATRHTPKGSTGFFHSTGHGLGLAVHEMPKISGAVDCLLPENAVVTVEPGLYYPGLGGCRIEDVVQVTPTSTRLLSRYHYQWELT